MIESKVWAVLQQDKSLARNYRAQGCPKDTAALLPGIRKQPTPQQGWLLKLPTNQL